jgi:hypothetical protein
VHMSLEIVVCRARLRICQVRVIAMGILHVERHVDITVR